MKYDIRSPTLNKIQLNFSVSIEPKVRSFLPGLNANVHLYFFSENV